VELRRFGPTKFQVPVIGQGTWRHGATPREVALRFLVRKPELFAIPKAAKPEHAAANTGAGDLQLTEPELARIDAAVPLGPRGRELPML
jgi:diketogulonate reductase-like aldo/keto reductase